MSLIREPPAPTRCACQATPATGKLRLTVARKNLDVRQHAKYDEQDQDERANTLQQLFLPTLASVDAHPHNGGYHSHPVQPPSGGVAHIVQLHDHMDECDLVARLSITPGGEERSVAALLDRAHVKALTRNGVADVTAAQGGGTFRLHSTREGRITGIEYLSGASSLELEY